MSGRSLKIKRFITNKLLDRRQFMVDIAHPGQAAPTRDQIKEDVASKLNANKDLCVIFGIKTVFGGGRTTGFGFVYDNKDALKQIEPLHRKVKAGIETKNKVPRRTRKDQKIKKAKVWGTGRRAEKHMLRRQQRKEEMGTQ